MLQFMLCIMSCLFGICHMLWYTSFCVNNYEYYHYGAWHDEEYHVDETLNTQQSSRTNQNSYLEQINEIFETFEASMRTCATSPDFVCCLVNLHQNSAKCICSESGKKCAIQCGHTLERLLQLINALQTSFTKFAASSKPFQSLLQSDQNELLKKNGLMFVMVSLQMKLFI